MVSGGRTAFAPGRVNLIGEHTDYTGGRAFSVAAGLGTRALFRPEHASERVEVVSRLYGESASLRRAPAGDGGQLATLLPAWARHAAGVVAAIRPSAGGVVELTGDLPAGAGLGSSASFALALALALGFEGEPVELAKACQRAEQLATGQETGLLDQLSSACGRPGQGMLLDFADLSVSYVAIPDGAEIVLVDSGERRVVAETAYGERLAQCRAAEAEIGPLRLASPGAEAAITDPLVARRVRHVIEENARVDAFAGALSGGDLEGAGRLMDESHASLATHYEVSTPLLDELVAFLRSQRGVLGARLTGAGFGGCAVALCRPGALVGKVSGRPHWRVEPSGGARLL